MQVFEKNPLPPVKAPGIIHLVPLYVSHQWVGWAGICPICGSVHLHGGVAGQVPEGHRSAHCMGSGAGGYHIVASTDPVHMTQTAFNALTRAQRRSRRATVRGRSAW